MRGRSSSRLRRARWACLVLALFAGETSRAQVAPSCDALIEAAEEHYVSRAFDEAEDLIHQCLRQAELVDSDALAAYRLLALVHLRQDDVSAARDAVLRLLSVSFEYEADPVQDPPVYAALVASIKEQLRVAGFAQGVPPTDAGVVSPDEAEEPEDGITSPIIRPRPAPEPDATPAPEPVAASSTNGLPRWLTIGGGAVVVTIVGLLLAGGGSSDAPGDPSLPTPPAFPP